MKHLRKKKSIFLTIFLSVSVLIILSFGGIIIYLYSVLSPLYPIVSHWESLLGFDTKKHYLVLLQNDSELRPTGGFISAFADITIKNGRILDMIFLDSYSLQHTQNLSSAPKPFQFFLKDDPKFHGWYFRDANFHPDFPSTAYDALKLFREQNDPQSEDVPFHGVFAVNFSFIEDIFHTFAPITLEGEEININELFDWIQFQTKNIDKHNVEALKNRKNILSVFASSLIKKVLYSPFSYSEVIEKVRYHLDRKSLLMFFKDSQLQETIEDMKWNGAFNAENKNFLHVNVANIGGRKADRYIQKNYEYHLKKDTQGRYQAHIILTFHHLGTYNLHSDLYQGYVRVYVPSNSKLVKNWGDFIKNEHKEDHTTVYDANYIKMLPGERRILHFVYDLPQFNIQTHSEVFLIKQSGSRESWNVSFQLPSGLSFQDSSHDSNFLIRENVAHWNAPLEKDTLLQLSIKEDTSPPLVVWQKFIDLNTLELNFSEEIDDSELKISQFSITDKNVADSVKDMMRITSVKKVGNFLYITLDGIQESFEEQYSLLMKNVTDLAGNSLNPNPMEITIVQRF